MARVPFTLRIDAEERAALENLSKVEGRPVDRLIDEAIRSYLGRQGQQERSLEANLAKLREERRRDPGFQRGIDAFVNAEASLEDVLEGEPLNGEFIDGQFKPAGPVQSRIRELLGA
jgi:predicted transcriptional regulator